MIQNEAVIAVLDDEPQLRKALSRLLKTHGYRVETFAGGEEFLSACPQQRFACVLLDLHMPGVNGFDVLGHFAQGGLPGPVIVITGHDEPGTAGRVHALGAVDYLLKPLDEAVLLTALDRVTHRP